MTPLDLVNDKYEGSLMSMSRAYLLEVLAAPLLAQGRIHFGKTVTALSQSSDSVTLEFVDGSTEQAALVVGADGVNSVLSRALAPAGKPRFAGMVSWYGTIHDCDRVQFAHPDLAPGAAVQAVGSEPVHFVAVSYMGGRPGVTPTMRYWHLEFAADTDQFEIPEGWNSHCPPKQALLDMTRDWSPSHPFRELIDKTPAENLVYFGLHESPSRPKEGWFQGRVVLIGDAVHPTLPYVGQGGNLAIEDGYVLATCLKDTGYDHKAAFELFYERRHARVAAIIK